MEEFLFDLLCEAADVAIDAIGALVAGAAVAYVAYKVTEKITESNIVEHILKAIRQRAKDEVKKKLGELINATIKAKKDNIVTISISNLGDDKPIMDLKLASDGGIDSSIRPGMKFKLTTAA